MQIVVNIKSLSRLSSRYKCKRALEKYNFDASGSHLKA